MDARHHNWIMNLASISNEQSSPFHHAFAIEPTSVVGNKAVLEDRDPDGYDLLLAVLLTPPARIRRSLRATGRRLHRSPKSRRGASASRP